MALTALAFMFFKQSSTIGELNFLLKVHDAHQGMQKSQILDLMQSNRQESSESYSRGFEDGRTQAGIALAQGNSLYEYKDGYHAALTQFSEPMDTNKSMDTLFADLLIHFMDREMSAEDSYWDLLEYMTEDPALNANTEEPNK